MAIPFQSIGAMPTGAVDGGWVLIQAEQAHEARAVRTGIIVVLAELTRPARRAIAQHDLYGQSRIISG